MDATIHAAVFHLQAEQYDDTRPPNFFDNDDLNKLNLTRNRKRHDDKNTDERILKSAYDYEKEIGAENTFARSSARSSPNDDCSVDSADIKRNNRRKLPLTPNEFRNCYRRTLESPLPKSVLDGQWNIIPQTPDVASSSILKRTSSNSHKFPSTQRPNQNFACRPNGQTPPLFLQELAHLSSLACAVALSTLRNDIEHSESPLDMYTPGSPWPVSDPDELPRNVRNEFQHSFHAMTILRHWLGMDRRPEWRSKYNASRPLLILGGVSDSEIAFLQKARGPHAKAQLALGWLEEFVVREHLAGSMGPVHSAIVSRLVQFLSDGMMYYHQARKVMYVPFPFPHAQLSAFFTAVMVAAVPFLMDQYTEDLRVGSLVSFLTVTCLVGLHEVARELENPFRNVPNEIPLCTLQAMYNEALVTMFSGYNPDSFWDAELYQGAMEAVALGKVYRQEGVESSSSSCMSARKDGVLEMPTLAESTNGMTSNNSPEKKVRFAPKVGTNNDASAKELLETLSKQAREIEELVRLLDEEENQ